MTDTSTTATIPAPTDEEPSTALPHPRIRIGAIVWGLIVAAIGAGSLLVMTDPERRDAALAGVLQLDAGTAIVLLVLAAGAAIALIAAVSLLTRWQRRRGSSA